MQLISKEAFSKDENFLLELVQNADDCTYAPGAEPTVLLILFSNGLLFATSEEGFTEADIKSICGIGGSTKIRSKGNFIGEKGE